VSDSPLAPFIPAPIAGERFAVTVRAPAALAYQVATTFDMQSIWSVRTIFQMRERIMGSRPGVRIPRGLLEELRGLGWGCLLERPGELYVGGAVCQPWLADVKFRAVPAEEFAAFAEPDLVKIAWTLETRFVGPGLTELVSETRVAATDDAARKRFLAYWRWARVGIYTIRWLLLPAIRTKAEGMSAGTTTA
jgi:hypothetical protein